MRLKSVIVLSETEGAFCYFSVAYEILTMHLITEWQFGWMVQLVYREYFVTEFVTLLLHLTIR